MQQTGEYNIGAPREQVWEALNDPDLLGECIAGCQSVTKVDDQHFEVSVKAKVGPVSATFNAELELDELNPPASYVITGNAKGGAAGFAKGNASVSLEEIEGGTTLRYGVEANVGGKLAQVGSRLIEGASRKMADDFFAEFCKRLDPEAVAVVKEDAQADDGNENKYESSGQMGIWLIAFGVLVLAVVLAI